MSSLTSSSAMAAVYHTILSGFKKSALKLYSFSCLWLYNYISIYLCLVPVVYHQFHCRSRLVMDHLKVQIVSREHICGRNETPLVTRFVQRDIFVRRWHAIFILPFISTVIYIYRSRMLACETRNMLLLGAEDGVSLLNQIITTRTLFLKIFFLCDYVYDFKRF